MRHTQSHVYTCQNLFFYPHPPLPVQETAPKTVSRGVTERVSAGILLYSLDCTMTRLVAAARRNLLVCHSPPAKLHTGFQYNSLAIWHICHINITHSTTQHHHHATHSTQHSPCVSQTAECARSATAGRDATTCETLDGWHNAKEE
jgi:hypothetical protein